MITIGAPFRGDDAGECRGHAATTHEVGTIQGEGFGSPPSEGSGRATTM